MKPGKPYSVPAQCLEDRDRVEEGKQLTFAVRNENYRIEESVTVRIWSQRGTESVLQKEFSTAREKHTTRDIRHMDREEKEGMLRGDG